MAAAHLLVETMAAAHLLVKTMAAAHLLVETMAVAHLLVKAMALAHHTVSYCEQVLYHIVSRYGTNKTISIRYDRSKPLSKTRKCSRHIFFLQCERQ